MDCPKPALWSKLTEHTLDPDEKAHLEQHAGACETCRQRMLEGGSSADALSSDTRELSPDELASFKTPAAPRHETLAPGTLVSRYCILEPLGSGGMAVVYAAYDPDLDRRVALKFLRPEQHEPGNSESLNGHQRLLREAQAMARLSHPNVVAAYDVGTFRDQVFIAIEYVDGCTLRAWLRDTPRSLQETLDVFRAAGRGLQAAHDAGLVHRDFKPDNVLVSRDGQVRVTDFGLVTAAHATAPETAPPNADVPSVQLDSGPLPVSGLTQVGHILGTSGFIAPEQYRHAAVDARTDQFAFCVSLYLALYKVKPFTGATPSELMKNVLEGRIDEAPPDAQVPAWIRRVLVRGLSTRADLRYPSMEALLGALSRDPRAAVRRWTVGAVAALGVVAASATISRAVDAREQLCSGATRKLEGIWDQNVRSTTRAAFAASGRSYAEEVFNVAARTLDRYSEQWAAMHVEACEATQLRGEQTEEVQSLRMICLDGRLRELAALSKVFTHADGVTVDKASQAAYQLAPISSCADVAALKASTPLPADPAIRSRIEALRTQLADIKALTAAGHFDEALPLAAAAGKAANELGYRPVLAETLAAEGDLLYQTGAYQKAFDFFASAAFEAHASGRDELVAQVSLQSAQCAGLYLGKPGDAKNWLRLGQSTVDRLQNNDLLRIEAFSVAGTLEMLAGRPSEGIAMQEQGLALAQRVLGEDHASMWKRYQYLGAAYQSKREFAQARSMLEKARAIKEPQGADHPDMGLIHSGLATVYFYVGDEEKSRRSFERALAIREKAFGPDNVRLFATLNNFADTLNRAGRPREALGYAKRAVALKGLTPGSLNAQFAELTLAEVQINLGDLRSAKVTIERVLGQLDGPNIAGHARVAALQARTMLALREGRLNEAVAFGDRAVAAGEKAFGRDSGDLAHALLLVGDAHLQARRYPQAVAVLTRAVSLGESGDVWPPLLADAQLMLARAQIAAGLDPGAARQVAKRARDAYERVSFRRAELAQANAFLATLEANGSAAAAGRPKTASPRQ